MMAHSRFPHTLTLLAGCIVLAAVLSYLLPAGRYDRRDDPATGRSVVVAGTYHQVPPRPVGFFEMLVAIPRGMADAGAVIFFVFIAGGAFTVIDQTGALKRGVGWLCDRLANRERLVIPAVSLLFATAGALENLQEEIIALVPVLLLLTRRLGFSAVTAVAVSIGSAAVGAAFSPMNPFQVGIAQKLAGIPLLSGAGFRLVFLIVAVAIWTWGTMRHAARTKTAPDVDARAEQLAFDARRVTVLAAVVTTFAAFIFGVMRLGWDFDQFSGLFLLMGVICGLVGGLGVNGTADGFVEGFRSVAFAGLVIGFARAVYVVLDQGRIIDTIVHGLVTPLQSLPVAASALGMIALHTLVHFPVPSVSGQAVLTMPVLVPVSDLLGLSRQVTVLAYQMGAGLCELMTPTNGALMAIIAAARVPFDEWLRFATPLYLSLVALGAVAVISGIALHLR